MSEVQQVREQMIELAVQGGMSREAAEAKFNNPSKLATWSVNIIATLLAVWFVVWFMTSPNVIGALGAILLIGGAIMVVLRVLAWGFTGSSKL
jgi:hypothetical protein